MPSARRWSVSRVQPADVADLEIILTMGLKRTFGRVKTDLTPELLFRAAREGAVSFWVIFHDRKMSGSIAVAHLPDGTGDILTLEGTKGLTWVPGLFAEWADKLRGLGLKRLALTGRKGWLRVLEPLGFVSEPDDGGTLIIMNRNL